MAKPHNKTLQAALSAIIASGRVSEEVGKPLIAQGLITVNDPLDVVDGNAAVTLTQKGMDGMPKSVPSSTPGASAAPSNYAIIDGAVLPPSRRGAGRVAGPPKYPFADLAPGKSFFVTDAEAKGNALKTLGSAVSNATNKYRVDTGKTEQVVRTKRDGKKAAVDAAGNKIKETVTVPVYEYPRKFTARGVKAGQKLGNWEAPADGAIVQRIV